ncbi:hypothetical protein KP509_03G002000 [Ceratopteris richardii]|nr:hypothetical protein KP509_03G002000 [Ceratopteris richardii]
MRVSCLCFLLTFLVLRNTIGAGKFGTPAQDYEEIKLHLHNVALHRKHSRMLAEVVEEAKVPSLLPEDDESDVPSSGVSRKEDGARISKVVPPVLAVESRNPTPEKRSDGYKPMPLPKQTKKKVALLANLDVNRKSSPILAVGRNFEGKDLPDWGEKSNSRGSSANCTQNVLMLLSSPCEKLVGTTHLLASLRNKLHYSALHGFQVSTSTTCLDSLKAEGSAFPSRMTQLHRSMVDHPHAEWLWWFPHAGLVITDHMFEFPLQRYAGFNVILLGSVGQTPHQQTFAIDLRTDTFLIRNCQWSKAFLKMHMTGSKDPDNGDILTFRSSPTKFGPEVDHGTLERSLSNDEVKASEQNINVEESMILHTHWKDVDTKMQGITGHPNAGIDEQNLPFIVHVLGCDGYTQGIYGEDFAGCLKHKERLMRFAEKQSKSRGKGSALSKHSLAQ